MTAPTTRTPVHFIAAVDVSSSMEENYQLGNVVTSLKFLLDYMTPDDVLSVITFGSDAEIVLRQVRTTSDQKDMIQFRLGQLKSAGMTNLSAALAYVPELVLPAGYKQGLLILTDGEVNRGITDRSALTASLVTLMASYPSLTPTMVGYGPGHNAALCRGMAAATSGTYDVVNTLEHVADVFGNTLGGLTTCAFQQVRVQLPDGVRQVSTFPVRDGGVLFVGDLQQGNEVIVLLENVEAPLTVRGMDVVTGSLVEVPVVIQTSPTADEVLTGLVASLRFRVVALMEESLTTTAGTPEFRAKCVELRDLLTPLFTQSSLVALLLSEVGKCEAISTRPAPLSRYQTSSLTQRTAYLGMGRGVLSQDSDPTDPPPAHAPAIDRSFSNPVQRAMSDGMRAQSSAVSADWPPPPPSIIRVNNVPVGRSPSLA